MRNRAIKGPIGVAVSSFCYPPIFYIRSFSLIIMKGNGLPSSYNHRISTDTIEGTNNRIKTIKKQVVR